MKNIIIVFFFTLPFTISAQKQWQIFKIQGCIKVAAEKSCLEKNSFIMATDSLYFSNPDDMAVVTDTSGEWLTLRAIDTTGYFEGRHLIYLASELIISNIADTIKHATRGKTSQIPATTKDLFGNERFTLVGDEARLTVSSREYALSKEKFLVFDYAIDTFKISKRLGFRDQVVRIQKNRLYELEDTVIEKPRIENVHLYYYEPATKNAELVTSFDLVFISEQDLFTDFDEVYERMPARKKNDPQLLFDTFELYFKTYYGNTDLAALKGLIEKYIQKLNQPDN